jgi:hypothetical protein
MFKIIIFLILVIKNLFSLWQGYDIYRTGAKGLGCSAFSAIANDSSAIYFNPSGLVQIRNLTIFYTLDAQLKIESIERTIRPELKITYDVPALLGFILPFKNNNYNTTIGLSAYSLFQRKIPTEFALYKFAPTIAFDLFNNFTVGLSPGLVYSTYVGKSSLGKWGFNLQFGGLLRLKSNIRIGLNYYFKTKVKRYKDTQTFPDILTIGSALPLTEKIILGFDLEYQNWKGISEISDGIEQAPIENIKTGLFKTIHPKIGVLFLEEKTGAHIRTGFLTDTYIEYDVKSENYKHKTQFLWSIGLGGYALKIVKVEATLVDSYLMHFINNDNNRIETIQITVEYRFE